MNTKTKTGPEIHSLLKRVAITSTIISVLAMIISLVFASLIITVSIASGWIISLASFFVLVMAVSKSFSGRSGATAVWAFLGIIKLGVLGALLWWLITKVHIEPFAFLGGFSTMIVALVVEGIRLRRSNQI